jgi:hypothetical protein
MGDQLGCPMTPPTTYPNSLKKSSLIEVSYKRGFPLGKLSEKSHLNLLEAYGAGRYRIIHGKAGCSELKNGGSNSLPTGEVMD